MLVDPTTLADLEVFGDATGRGGVFALLDTAETERGRKALRRRLASPFSDAPSIIETQRAVEFFFDHPDGSLARSGSTESVARYLESNIEVASPRSRIGSRFKSLWLLLRHRDVCREMREGVSTTATLLRELAPTVRTLLAQNPPPLVRTLASAIVATCEGLETPSRPPSMFQAMRLDRAYRRGARSELARLIECVGELDALRTMARSTKRLGWTMPEIVDGADYHLEGEGLFHPFLETPVVNPIDVSGAEPMVFLTGPNMAGKTTYLRTAALVVLLAQVGMGVPARRVRLTPVEVLLTGLNPADNLRAGLSFFLSEVLRVREAAVHLVDGKRCFIVFDEVFKGTNVQDAMEASSTVIRGFAKARGSGFIFSSHLVELVESLRADGRIRFHFFEGSVGDEGAEYSFDLRAGVSSQRFGLHLLNEAHIPDLLDQIGG